MLKLIKKFTNKNLKGSCGTTVSTATMTNEEYIAAIEGGILPHWADKELMQKTGIQDLFAENAKINIAMSYEDICDCLNRVYRMIDIAAYVGATFSDRSNEIDDNNQDAYKQHLQDISTGRKIGKFVVKNDFYSADTIRDLFIEAQTSANLSDVDIPDSYDAALEKLNSAIASLSCVKNITFSGILVFARVASAEMVGFKE